MIDIHHHCLPGVDDGPRSWEDAVEQCGIAADEGIETIVATPHVLRGSWENEQPDVLQQLVDELNARVGGKPKVVLGSEYFFGHDVVERVEQKRGIVTLAGSRYLLVEFAAASVPPLIESVFFKLRLRGITPIVAHPERNLVFQTKPALLKRLVDEGARTQVTAGSLFGGFGERAESAAVSWIEAELVHVIATDAHSCGRRAPRAREVREVVAERWGETRAAALFDDNPRAVVENRHLPYEPEAKMPEETTGFLGRFKRLFAARPGRG